MNSELRRSPRYTDFLPISLLVNRGRQQISGPYSARVTDISYHGAQLLLTRVMMDSFHIFHSTREDDSQTLQLIFSISKDDEDITVSARPVWLDSTQMEDMKVFKMGVDFTEKLDDYKLKELSKRIKQL